jgi:hypothetical protein
MIPVEKQKIVWAIFLQKRLVALLACVDSNVTGCCSQVAQGWHLLTPSCLRNES